METQQETQNAPKHRRRKRVLIAVAVVLSVLILLFAAAFIVAYYRGSSMIKSYLEAKVKEQTKGLYTLQMKSLNLILFPARLKIEELSLIPDTARYRELLKTDTLSSVLLTVHIGKLVVTDLDVYKAIRKKEVELKKLLVSSPDLRLDEYDVPPGRLKKKEKHEMKLYLSLPKGFSQIDIRMIRLDKGKLLYCDHRNDTLRQTGIPEFSLAVDSIHIDSTISANLFNAADIRVVLKGISKTSKNGLNTISLGEIGLSTAKKELYVKDFHLKPEVSKEEYGRKLGYQTDWMDVKAKEIRLSGVDIPQLLLNEYFRATRLTLDGIELEDYRDKRNPPRKNWKPLMPHEALTNLKIQIHIDSVVADNTKLTYSEQTGDKPGTIFFDQVHVDAGPVSNDSAMMAAGFIMRVNGRAKLMGSGPITLAAEFPMPAKNGAFSFSGLLTGFEMTNLNPFVSGLLPAKIVSGYVDKLVIMPVHANTKNSEGKLVLYYHNLKLDLPPQTDKKWEIMKKSVLAWAANTYVAESNPSQKGNLREGIIYVERDPSKSIFNYLWKSLFSGIKSTVNVNTKEQKEIKKEIKQQKQTNKKKN
jgi:hypothetical protein